MHGLGEMGVRLGMVYEAFATKAMALVAYVLVPRL